MRLLIFSLLVFLSISAFATANSAPVALHIYLYDDAAILEVEEELVENLYLEAFPDLRFERVKVSLSQSPAEIRKKLIQAIGLVQLKDGETITHLIIDDHGITTRKGEELVTELSELGVVSSRGVDPAFAQVFDGLLPRFSDDLKILFNACLVFCGPVKEAEQRATALLNYFGADNGEVYGSSVPEVSTAFEDLSETPLEYFVPSKKIVAVSLAVAGAIVFAGHIDGSTPSLLSHEILYGSAVWAGTLASMNAFRIVYQKFAARFFFNRGWVFRFKNSKVVEKIKTSKRQYLDALLNRCNSLLGSS